MALQQGLSSASPVSFPDRSVDRLAQGGVRLPYCITGAWAAGTAPCDIKLTGVDSQLANLTGGMDGLYKLWSCEGGRPLYKREEPGAWLYLHVCLYGVTCVVVLYLHKHVSSVHRKPGAALVVIGFDLFCACAQLCIHSSTANPDPCNDLQCSFSCTDMRRWNCFGIPHAHSRSMRDRS